MVERDGVERAEARQVVLVRRVVAVPGHHVEGRERLRTSNRGLRLRSEQWHGLASPLTQFGVSGMQASVCVEQLRIF